MEGTGILTTIPSVGMNKETAGDSADTKVRENVTAFSDEAAEGQLKYTIRTTGAEGIQNLFIIIINLLHIQSHSCILLDQLYCILDHSQSTKSQEVHF